MTKSWFQSLTIQGSIVGAFPAIYTVAHAIGLNIPQGSLEAIVNGVMAIMAIASVVMTFVGRLRARHVIVTPA